MWQKTNAITIENIHSHVLALHVSHLLLVNNIVSYLLIKIEISQQCNYISPNVVTAICNALFKIVFFAMECQLINTSSLLD